MASPGHHRNSRGLVVTEETRTLGNLVTSFLDQLEDSKIRESILDQLGDGVATSTSYRAVERFLEEGRRFKLIDDEVTPEKLVERYDRQRWWFQRLFLVASILGFLIVTLGVTLASFDLSMGVTGDNGPLSTRGIQALHIHSLSMILSAVIGLPLGVVLYRLFPSINLWTLNYVHGGIWVGLALLVTLGLSTMVICHDHFGLPHFRTLHAWLGSLLTLMMVGQLISGALFLRAKYRLEVMSKADLNVHFHKLVGEVMLVVSIGTWVSGISGVGKYYVQKKWILENAFLWNVIGILSFIFSLILLVLIFHPIFRRRGRPNLELIFLNPNNWLHDSSTTVVSREELLSAIRDKIQKSRVINSSPG